MKIGIIGPTPDEINPFIEMDLVNSEVSSIAQLKIYSGLYNEIEVVCVCCGICKVNAALATQILISEFNVSHIIVSGVAGGIDPKLKIGDTVLATSIAYHDVNMYFLNNYPPYFKTNYFNTYKKFDDIIKEELDNSKLKDTIYFGKIVTGESFITDEGREGIINKYNPLCVDMETASIAHVCQSNKIPFYAIRTITDTEDDSGVSTFEENVKIASKKSIDVLKLLLNGIS